MKKNLSLPLIEFDDFWISPSNAADTPVAVTVIIPAYQSESTLSRALQSVVSQSLREIEIIVADDGSSDATWETILDWLPRDGRIRGLRNKSNSAKSATMNRAIPFARGRWIAILDADDWFHADRLKNLIALGEKWNVHAVADNQIFHDALAMSVTGSAWSIGTTEWQLECDDYLIGSHAYESFNLGMLKPIVSAEFIRETGLTYDEAAKRGQDFFYLLRLFLLGGRAVVSDAAYYFYTMPFGSASRKWSHAMRRRYDFQLAYTITQTYVVDEIQNLTPRQMYYLKLRSRRMRALEHYFRAREALGERNWTQFFTNILQHPEMLNYVARRALGRWFAYLAPSATARVVSDCRERQRTSMSPLAGKSS